MIVRLGFGALIDAWDRRRSAQLALFAYGLVVLSTSHLRLSPLDAQARTKWFCGAAERLPSPRGRPISKLSSAALFNDVPAQRNYLLAG